MQGIKIFIVDFDNEMITENEKISLKKMIENSTKCFEIFRKGNNPMNNLGS